MAAGWDLLSPSRSSSRTGLTQPAVITMNIQQFLAHHSLTANPFVEEDAQTDRVFKEHCLRDTFHPAWEKIYGNPADPSTSIVFGEKGSGKTAIRLQMFEHLLLHNGQHPAERVSSGHWQLRRTRPLHEIPRRPKTPFSFFRKPRSSQEDMFAC